MTVSAPSAVRMVVERRLISRTVPETPAASTVSPGWIGRSNISTSPETKLLTIFCRPNPMPTPRAPNTMASCPSATPAADSAIKKPASKTA